MPDFLDRLGDVLDERREELSSNLRLEATAGEVSLERLVRDHWSSLPPSPDVDATDWAAYAVDGSLSEIGLDNGSHLIIVQALALGQAGFERPSLDLQVLPATIQRSTAARVADLLQQRHEISLAVSVAEVAAEGSVLFLDGALYGRLPQLYSLNLDEVGPLAELPDQVLHQYLTLMRTAAERGIRLVAVSKTSHEATHAKLWLDAAADSMRLPEDATDSGLIHRFTDRSAGLSDPVLLGGRGFTGGSRDILGRPEVSASPAIVSFFVRLADFDDALRIDVPATQCGSSATLGSLEADVLEGGAAAVHGTVGLLQADYGGLEVYNALLYSVDREVRLKRNTVREVYLPMIEQQLGLPVRRNRSERRF